jgi:lysophospholipase L1-like esterase
MRRFAVLLALLPILASIQPAVAAVPPHRRVVLAAVPIGRMDLPWWRRRFEEKRAELRRGPVDLVFYGDSITQDWERTGPQTWADFHPIWEHYYGGRHAVNLGFVGDTTASLIWRIDHGEASGISPKVAVVLIGANDMGRPHWSAPDTVDGIETVIRLLRRHLPGTNILLLAVLPSIRSPWITETTTAINQRLAELYGNGRVDHVIYMDLTRLFLRHGRVDRSLYLDPHLQPPAPPLHPTAQAQATMAAAMEPVLARLMGDQPRRAIR